VRSWSFTRCACYGDLVEGVAVSSRLSRRGCRSNQTTWRTVTQRQTFRATHRTIAYLAGEHCVVAAHLFRRTYMIAAPPGRMVTATGYGRSASWLVTVRPAMMPTAEPNTASLSQWRFAGRRERATYDEKTYAGIEYFQL